MINEIKEKGYSGTDYKFGKTTVRYVVMNDTKAVFMLLFPNEYSDKILIITKR